MGIETALPAELRTSTTAITKIAAGMSGAGVYRVDADGASYVLKISSAQEPLSAWQRKVHLQQRAAEAGVAPAVIHVNESHRAVLSAFVVDRSFPALFGNPATRARALMALGETLRRAHGIALPHDAAPANPLDFLSAIWAGPVAAIPVPEFVRDAVQHAEGEHPPAMEHAPVLSHNDVNPTNLVFDGERLMLLDWETAGPNDPLYDLAAISVFLRMDDDTCRALLSAYEGTPVEVLSPRFRYNRRIAATLCGSMLLHLAQQGGHAGARPDDTRDSTLSLSDFYQRLRAGGIDIATANGQWMFGLALIKEGAA